MSEPNMCIALVPTILLPLTMVSVFVTTIATYVAGLFGIKLKAEGPRKLLELLLKPRVLISALVLNLLVVVAIKYVRYTMFYPEPLSKIASSQELIASASDCTYENSEPNSCLPLESRSNLTPRIQGVEVGWTVKLPKGAFCEGTLSGGSIFYGVDDGYIYELAKNSGTIKRRFYVGTKVTPNPFIWNGRIYVGEGLHFTHHARAYAYDLATGSYIGAYPTLGHTEGQPLIASHNGSDLMFVVSGKDGIHAVDPITLTQVWHQVDGHIDASVRVKNGRVFAGTAVELGDRKNSEPTVAAYAFLDGKKLWENKIPASSWAAPIMGEDEVYFVLGEIYDKLDFGQLACYDQATGKLRWKIDTPVSMNSMPVKVGNRIYAADRREYVNLFDLETRTLAWSQPTVETSDASLVAGLSYDPYRHVILYPSFTDGLYALDPDSGEVLFRWKPKSEVHPWRGTYAAVVVTADFWYLCDNSGTVRCLRPL